LRQGYHAMKAIMESKITSNKLKTVLRFLLDGYDQDIYTDKQGMIYIHHRHEKTSYPLLCTISVLIEEACVIALAMGMSKEAFEPVGLALDKI
jgi:hypothetical protein